MNNLGVALQGQGRHKEAVAAFENAAKLNPRAELVRRNLFSQTRRYIGLGVIAILIVQGIRLGIVAHASPVAFIVGLAILLLGVWVIYVIRKRRLSPTVRQFYELEERRRWPLAMAGRASGVTRSCPGWIPKSDLTLALKPHCAILFFEDPRGD